MRLTWVLAVAFQISAVCGCATDESGCDPESVENGCLCEEGGSCELSCPLEAESCGLNCVNNNTDCAVKGGDNCGVTCQSTDHCSAECGADSLIACQDTNHCSATVGDNADVRCEGSRDCRVTCEGSCTVTCPRGVCRVTCADPAVCELFCDKNVPPPGLCADGVTKTCGTEC